MNDLSITPATSIARWDCPECHSTGSVAGEICPVCLGAKWIDSVAITKWLLDFMESWGCNPTEIELLRKQHPDPFTFALCLGVCSAVQDSNCPRLNRSKAIAYSS